MSNRKLSDEELGKKYRNWSLRNRIKNQLIIKKAKSMGIDISKEELDRAVDEHLKKNVD